MTNEQKEYLIAKALETEEGRLALQQAMCNGLRMGSKPKVSEEDKIFSMRFDETDV